MSPALGGAPARNVAVLAKQADVLVLASPGGEGTRGLVDRAVLDALGPEGYLVNVARGSVVEEPALLDALERKTIAGAALDVFASEPNIDQRFLALDNVVLQPHSASITRETRAAMLARLLGDIESFVDFGPGRVVGPLAQRTVKSLDKEVTAGV